MPVHIGEVTTQIIPAAPRDEAPPAPAPSSRLADLSDDELTERLRPIVLEILRQELDELRRRRGL